MKRFDERQEGLERLLDDVLRDEAGQAVEAAARQACLQELARRRRSRRLFWVAPLVAAAVLFLALRLFELSSGDGPPAPLNRGPSAGAHPAWLARSAPLGPHALVTTLWTAGRFATVATVPLGDLAATTRPPADLVVAKQIPVAVVAGASQPVIELTDEELLALFPDAPRTLVALGGGRKELRFLQPSDTARYLAPPGDSSR